MERLKCIEKSAKGLLQENSPSARKTAERQRTVYQFRVRRAYIDALLRAKVLFTFKRNTLLFSSHQQIFICKPAILNI